MKTDQSTASGLSKEAQGPLRITLAAIPSRLKTTGDQKVQFTRAVLEIKNAGLQPANAVIRRATVVQEGGNPQDVAAAMLRDQKDLLLESGESRDWDLYELLVAGHPGVASKVHLFGYKAVLNWWFVLSLQVEYPLVPGSSQNQAQFFKTKFRWQARPSALDEVHLEIDPVPSG